LHEKAEPSGSVFFEFFSVIPSRGHREQAHSYNWNAVSCRSEPARDIDVTVGALLQFDLPIQVQNQLKKPPYLYPVHHLIS
jgi:hypothetical protein